ncbi:hypothetical protein QYE76_043082 [Lolium multiflorum]|uniref:Uncharacterized protein n=1 Tax=Lolium multiflorum TaxID=4521 RepID=A0AAD8WVR9_LOLMU|nr:hypothetical protein QYE76_043082 [Lolium multiflorum]
MGKKRTSTTAIDATSSGVAARSGPNPPKRSASHAPPLAPVPPAPSSFAAGSAPSDWPASTTTKRDEKKAKSLGYIPSEEGNVILPADDLSDTAESMHDDDADQAAFVDAAAEEAKALPSKRSYGGFADEDDLWDLDEDFIEPPPKKSKTGAAPSDLAASEASAPATILVAQMTTASSLSKGKNIPSTDAAAAPPSGKPEVESSSSKLEGAIKIAAEARTEIDTLKEELKKLKQRLKDEEAAKLTAEARALEKDELLRQSSLALLRAADIPVEALDKVLSNSPSNVLSMTLASHQLVQDLLQKSKGAMARIHSMIFPKISQDKTLGQLIDAFAVNTKEVIEVYPVPSFVDDSSSVVPESDRLQRMRDRVAQMEKDMHNTYTLAAIVNKKNELAADTERYALTELHKAAESLNFKCPDPLASSFS